MGNISKISLKKNICSALCLAPKSSIQRPVFLNAKYGDKSIYFDLSDMENTVGSWDMQENEKRYPALQEEFFDRAGQALNRREAMLVFCATSGFAAVAIWGLKGSEDAKLPNTIGPLQPSLAGPRGRI